jgi:hypothetical protein
LSSGILEQARAVGSVVDPEPAHFASARTKNFISQPYFGEPAYNAMAIAG